MALINCRECGKEISDQATVCPHCGCPVSKQETSVMSERTELLITRKKGFVGMASKHDLYADGNFVCSIMNGETYRLNVFPGTHRIKIIDKTNFNKAIFDDDIYVKPKGLEITYYPTMNGINIDWSDPCAYKEEDYVDDEYRRCPCCGGKMVIQTFNESKGAGCGTIFLYILLAITCCGLLVLIPILLRKKDETVTYAICQKCGYKQKIG